MRRSKSKIENSGFTLIEMIVATTIFTVVMLVVMGALLSLNDSSRKAQALRTVIDNLNFALEDMSRIIRTGSSYHCYTEAEAESFANDITSNSGPKNCSGDNAGKIITLQDQDGVWVAFKFNQDVTNNNRGTIEETSAPKGSKILDKHWSGITSTEVDIKRMEFRVIGTNGNAAGKTQPIVLLSISGDIDLQKEGLRTDFSIQTAISQRGIE